MAANDIVAKNLLMLRTARGMNQTQAGAVIDVSQQTWARYEKGVVEITVNLLEEIAQKFHVPIARFFEPYADFGEVEPKKGRTTRQGEKQAAHK